MSFTPLFRLAPRPYRELSPATSSRKQHIRFVNDILHVCLQRGDLPRARRAWAVLVKCPEIDMRTIWQVGLALIPGREDGKGRATREHVNYLKRVRLQIPQSQETLLKETVLALIDMGEYQEALDELDLYIVTMPFDQNPVLHLYAGMLWLYIAQPESMDNADPNDRPNARSRQDSLKKLDTQDWNASRVASAKRHFRRAIALDPGNAFARGFLDRLGCDVTETQPVASGPMPMEEDEDLDEEMIDVPTNMVSESDPVESKPLFKPSSDEEAEEARPAKRARSKRKGHAP